MLEIGTKVFGEWSIDEKIGSGAFGTVYKIKRDNFGTTYYAALKVINIPQDPEEHSKLRSEGMDNESISTYYGQIAQDFIKEIELLSTLDGITNIVDYKDHNIVSNDSLGYTIYIKMQLLTPLSKKLLNDNDNAVFLPKDEILNLGIDICSALEVCEKHKIIHRDIKIDNIFVSINGDYKLGDFGIAKQLEATQGEMSKKGTMMYMAPEVFKGENYNHTVDIYSLGIVMYRLLNKNRAPFFPQYPNPIKFSDKETANAQRLNGAVLPAIPGVNDELMAVLRKSCAFKAEDRYQSAAELKKELKNILKALPNEIIAEQIEPSLTSASTAIIENVVDTCDENDIEKTVGIFDATVSEIKTFKNENIDNYDDSVENTVGVFTEPELVTPMELNESIEVSKESNISNDKDISSISKSDKPKDLVDSAENSTEKPASKKNTKSLIIGVLIGIIALVLLIGAIAISKHNNNDVDYGEGNVIDTETVTNVGEAEMVTDVGEAETVIDDTNAVIKNSTEKNNINSKQTEAVQNHPKVTYNDKNDEPETPSIYFHEIFGLPEENAKAMLDDAFVYYNVTYVYSSSGESGTVVGGDGWINNTDAYPFDEVEIFVSVGDADDNWNYYETSDGDYSGMYVEYTTVYDVTVIEDESYLEAVGITWDELVSTYGPDMCPKPTKKSNIPVGETVTYDWANVNIEVYCYEKVYRWRWDYKIWD